MKNNPNTLPDPSDPNFDKESLYMLVELFAPADSDKQTLRAEVDKALEETKERMKNGKFNDIIDYDSKRTD